MNYAYVMFLPTVTEWKKTLQECQQFTRRAVKTCIHYNVQEL